MRQVITLILVVLSLVSTRALADGMLKLAATYLSSSTDSGSGGESKTTRTLMEANPAYLTQKGWAFGAIYAQEKVTSNSASGTRTSYGPTVGWVSRKENGAFLLAHYHFKSELDEYEGDGYQADLGYKFAVRRLSVGLQMSYKMFNYKKLQGNTLSSPLKESKIDPYFTLLIEF